MFDVLPSRRKYADDVDAEVLVESAVLDGEECSLDIEWDAIERHQYTVLLEKLPQDGVIGRENLRFQGRLYHFEPRHRWKISREPLERSYGDSKEDDNDDENGVEKNLFTASERSKMHLGGSLKDG